MENTNKMQQKTSIVITCYNYGRYLKESIDSVLFQTVKPLEVLVINDSSDDNTDSIARSYGDKIKYFLVDFRNSQKTRNFGLSKALGEYIVFLDADDYLRNDFLQETQKELNNNKGIVLVYSDRNNFGDTDLMEQLNINSLWQTREFDYKELTRGNYISLPALIRKKEFNGFDERIRRFQDWDAWLTLLKNKNAKKINEPLFFVRYHGQNKTLNTDGLIERIKILSKHQLFEVLRDDFIELENKVKVELLQKEQEIYLKNQEIKLMQNSKFWKIRDLYLKIKEKLCLKK